MDFKDNVAKEHQKIYYSSWLYSATRLSLLKGDIKTVEQVSKFLGYPEITIQPILDFLVNARLVSLNQAGVYTVTEK